MEVIFTMGKIKNCKKFALIFILTVLAGSTVCPYLKPGIFSVPAKTYHKVLSVPGKAKSKQHKALTIDETEPRINRY